MLALRDVTVRYGAVTALSAVSLDVPRGQSVAILGANGAGKTTLLRAVSGIVRVAEGSIVLDGHDIARTPPERIVRLGSAHVPEGRGIFPDLTVRENLLIGAYSRATRTTLRRDYAEVLATFPALSRREHQRGSTLSGGEQQMLAIGRALMSRPKLLLADEVSLGLAPVIIRQVFAELDRLRKSGITLLIVEQNAHLAMRFADYVHVLKHGRIVMSGTPDELSASSDLVDAYLGA
jgi:branched-chain amino acid transport system ATP-binding protein